MNVNKADAELIIANHSGSKSKTSADVRVFLGENTAIELPTVLIEAKRQDFFINGKPMGKEINAIVDKSGNVILGAFLRNFD